MINPVLKKELKTKMRTWKTPIMISLYIAILAFFMLFIYLEVFVGYRSFIGFRPQSLKEMYLAVIILQLFMLIFIVPATTVGSISGEKERRTFDLLVCTRLSSLSIILGKLSAALSQVILLLFASVPVLSILFLFGGISPLNVITVFIFYVVTAILLGSIGLFSSTFFKRTITSTIISYLATFFLIGGTFIIVFILEGLFRVRLTPVPQSITRAIMYMNPFSGIASIISYQLGEDILGDLIGRNTGWSILVPLYFNMGFDLVVSAILLFIASIRINPMKKLRRGFKK